MAEDDEISVGRPAGGDAARAIFERFTRRLIGLARVHLDERFAHRAFWDAPMHRIEMRLVAASAQTVRLAAIPLTLTLAAGEEISTEISTKYDRAMAADLLAGAGFRPIEWFTDPGERFGLTLAARD